MVNLVELQGVNFTNKGGELMGYAVLEHFRGIPVNLDFGVPLSSSFSPRRAAMSIERIAYLQKERLPGMNVLLGAAVKSTPKFIRKPLGLRSASDVRAVLDASGFRYSDQWGVAPIRTAAGYAKALASRGLPYILLPQAFGPFRQREGQDAIRQLVAFSSLVFARDAVSHAHLEAAKVDMAKVRHAPDFTNLVSPKSDGPLITSGRMVIVPNSRMLDKMEPALANKYVPLLADVIKIGQDAGLEPLILIHDRLEDMALVPQLNSVLGAETEVCTHADPAVLKGYLAAAQMVVTSRFHAAVGGLSCGVPTICLGWSHKYQQLMNDYGVPEYALNMQNTQMSLSSVSALVESCELMRVKKIISGNAKLQKAKTTEMWLSVDEALSSSGIFR